MKHGRRSRLLGRFITSAATPERVGTVPDHPERHIVEEQSAKAAEAEAQHEQAE